MTFLKALRKWQQDMKKRATIYQGWSSKLEYSRFIYEKINAPNFVKEHKTSPAWLPEVYLMEHHKTEFLAWLKLQL
jgi:hypothetical protein